MSFLTAQSTGVHLDVTKYPPCSCGHAFGAHACQAWHPVGKEPCTCHAYSAHGRIEWLGTRAISYPSGMPLLRRLSCQVLWAIESRIQMWRERIEQS